MRNGGLEGGQREREMGRGRQETLTFRHSRRAQPPHHAPYFFLYFSHPSNATPPGNARRRWRNPRVARPLVSIHANSTRARGARARVTRVSRDDLPSSFHRINQEQRRLTYAPKPGTAFNPRLSLNSFKSCIHSFIQVMYSFTHSFAYLFIHSFTYFFAPSAPAGCLFASHAAFIPTVVRPSSSEGTLTSQERLARYTYLPAYHGEDLQVLKYAFGRDLLPRLHSSHLVSSRLVYHF